MSSVVSVGITMSPVHVGHPDGALVTVVVPLHDCAALWTTTKEATMLLNSTHETERIVDAVELALGGVEKAEQARGGKVWRGVVLVPRYTMSLSPFCHSSIGQNIPPEP